MNWKDYSARFPQEIGRAVLRERNEHHVYHTNPEGQVGVWITNIRTTEGHGKELLGDDAAACLHWCQQKKSWAERVKREEQGRGR